MKDTKIFILECLKDLSGIDWSYVEEHLFKYYIDTVSHGFRQNVHIGSLALVVQLFRMSVMQLCT